MEANDDRKWMPFCYYDTTIIQNELLSYKMVKASEKLIKLFCIIRLRAGCNIKSLNSLIKCNREKRKIITLYVKSYGR